MVAVIKRYNPQVSRQISAPTPVRATQTSAGALATGLNDVADTAQQWQDEIDTATAKKIDSQYSDLIRQELYGDNGFMNLDGGNAIAAREDYSRRIEEQYNSSLENLTIGARQKAQSALEARRQSALQSMDRHASGERKTYLNSASEARMTTLANDAVFDFSVTNDRVKQITAEVYDYAARNGLPPEQRDLMMAKQTGAVYAQQVSRLANADPIAARDYLAEHRDEIAAADAQTLRTLESTIIPLAKKEEGRKLGQMEATGTGNMKAAFQIAQSTVGLNETTKVDVLNEYLKNGGQNLNPQQLAWCASYVNATLAQAGIEGTGSNLARSFLNWGVEVDQPQRGDIVVLSRGNDPTYGHVGFFDGYNEDGTVRILGGNQGDAVNVSSYNASRVLGFRRADGGGVTDDPAGAMQRIMSIEDDDVRDAALSEFKMHLSVAQLAAQQEEELVVKDVVTQIAQWDGKPETNPVNNLSLDQRVALGVQLDALDQHAARKASGYTYVTTPKGDEIKVEAMRLVDQVASGQPGRNPLTGLTLEEATAKLKGVKPMVEWREHLSDADFDRLTSAQSSALNPSIDRDAMKPISVNTVLSSNSFNYGLKAMGIDKTTAEGSKAIKAIERNLRDWQMANPELARDQNAVSEYAETLLMEVTVNPSGMFNEQTAALGTFDFNGTTISPDDDLDLQTVREIIDDGGLKINGEPVEKDMANRVWNAMLLDANGVETFDELLSVDQDQLVRPDGRSFMEQLAEVYR
jgi:uncharacterized protein (TIGR02594 family)